MEKNIMILAELGIIPILVAVLCFGFIFSIAVIYNPKKRIVEEYQRLDSTLSEKKKVGLFDYKTISDTLIKNGIAFHHPSISNPIIYTSVKIIIGAVAALVSSQVNVGLIPFVFFLGYKLLDIYGLYINRRDNELLQKDLQLVYNSLSIQINGGVYVLDALCENYDLVGNKRLKLALMELSGDIIMNHNPVNAINNFQSKFSNRYIDSLCITLLQSLESGKSVELLADISEQLKTFQETLLTKKKAELDRSMTTYELILFADIMIFMIFVLISNLLNVAALF